MNSTCMMSILQLHPECNPVTLIQSIANNSSAMCAELEEASGIKLLEEGSVLFNIHIMTTKGKFMYIVLIMLLVQCCRLRKMVQHLFHMWKVNITLSCQGMITKSLTSLSEVQHKAEEHVKGN